MIKRKKINLKSRFNSIKEVPLTNIVKEDMKSLEDSDEKKKKILT